MWRKSLQGKLSLRVPGDGYEYDIMDFYLKSCSIDKVGQSFHSPLVTYNICPNDGGAFVNYRSM